MENQPDVLRGRLIMKVYIRNSGALGKEGRKSYSTEKTALGRLLEEDFVKSFTFLKKKRSTEKGYK